MTTLSKSLTERRAADRSEMARQVRALCAELGAGCTDGEHAGPREIALEITHAGGARLWLDFDGDSGQPDIHVACWNVAHDSPARFHRSFGDVNPYHFRKSQFVAYGFEALLRRLRHDLEQLNAGTAYKDTQPEADPDIPAGNLAGDDDARHLGDETPENFT